MSLNKQPRKSKRWLRRIYVLLLLLVLAPPALLLRDVYRIPDYRGGNAYISTSPDGMYKGINMYTPENKPRNGWAGFLMGVSGYDSEIVMGIADGKTGRMLAYVPIQRNDLSDGDGGIWTCLDTVKGPCIRYRSSFWNSDVDLPPNHWHRLVAWAAFKLRGLGESEFGKVKLRDSGALTHDFFDEQ